MNLRKDHSYCEAVFGSDRKYIGGKHGNCRSRLLNWQNMSAQLVSLVLPLEGSTWSCQPSGGHMLGDGMCGFSKFQCCPC